MATNTEDEIKAQYAKEAANYREEALKVNYEFDKFWEVLKKRIEVIFSDHQYPIKVLDLGAGTGMLTERLLQEYPNAHVTMLDFSPEMLARGKAYLDEHGLNNGNIQQVCSNFITDEFPDEKYELIISSYALHHVRTPEDLELVYRKIANALHEGYGTFLCIDYYLQEGKRLQIMGMEKFRQELRKHFSEDKVEQWIDLIRAEDTPATRLQTFVSLGYGICRLLGPTGNMTSLYGMTKLPMKLLVNDSIPYFSNMFKEFHWEFITPEHPIEMGQYPELPKDSESEAGKPRK